MQTLIEALSRPEPPQPKEGKHGDPQLAALCQFLVQNNWENDHVLVDFGSGNGVLAETLNNVYPPDKKNTSILGY